MGTGWRRALCTSAAASASPEEKVTMMTEKSPTSGRRCGKLGFYFTGSGGAGGGGRKEPPPELRCRTGAGEESGGRDMRSPADGVRKKALLGLPLLKALSAPASPRSSSPSPLAMLKTALLLSRARCGVCAQSIKGGGRATAVFTAVCSHSFHATCIAGRVRSSGAAGDGLACPVCSASWPSDTVLAAAGRQGPSSGRPSSAATVNHVSSTPLLKVYDDDESLAPSDSGHRHSSFHPIPEADEDDGDSQGDMQAGKEFKGFFATRTDAAADGFSALSVTVAPEAALVSSGRSHSKYIVAITVKAPPAPLQPSFAHRSPIDLVAVLDVSPGTTGEKLQTLKRGMRLVIGSLNPADRLAIVAFSGAAKRLLPLRLMSPRAQWSARQIVDRLVLCAAAQNWDPAAAAGKAGTCLGDAMKKAAKVLEDRRERNPAATVLVLSDAEQHQPAAVRKSVHLSGAACFEIPLSMLPSVANADDHHQAGKPANPMDDALTKCLGDLVGIAIRNVRVQLTFSTGGVWAVYHGALGHRDTATGATAVASLGDMYPDEERELIVELRAPSRSQPNHPHSLSVQCGYCDPSTGEARSDAERPVLLPPLHSGSSSLRLHSLYITSRALAESRRLVTLGDAAAAMHVLTSARTTVLQQLPQLDSSTSRLQELMCCLDAEITGVQLRCNQQPPPPPPHQPRREPVTRSMAAAGPEVAQQLTPTSAWRAAEQLAKVAIMRKSMNRVGDLHGFEDARF